MEYQGKYGMPGYYKIMAVSLKPDGCRILKGPREEKKLAEILRDDYNIGRYEKMIQLVIREMVEEGDQERILHLLSTEHLCDRLCNGEARVACSYLRKVDGEMLPVLAEVYPRKFGEQGELLEFMVYVRTRPEIKSRIEGCEWENEDAGKNKDRKSSL